MNRIPRSRCGEPFLNYAVHDVVNPDNYLQAQGHTTALLGAGADLHNTFLAHGLVDELIFNVVPVLEGKGLNLLLDTDHYQYKDVQLVDFKSLGGDVVQLHYAVAHTKAIS